MGSAASVFEQNQALNDYNLKQKRLCAEFTITGSATPANKVLGFPELPGLILLRTQGQTSVVDAIETISYTTPVDESTGNSVFGVLIRGDTGYLGSIKKILLIRVTDRGTTGTSLAVTIPSGTTSGLTADGHVAFNVVGTGLRLDTENADVVIELEYVAQR